MDDIKQSLTVKNLVVGAYANAALPANAPNGMICYDVTNSKIVVRVGGAWETVTSA